MPRVRSRRRRTRVRGATNSVSDTSALDADPNWSVSFGFNTPAGTDYLYISDDDVLNYTVISRAVTATPKVSPGMPDTTLFNDRDMFPAACILVNTRALNAYDTPTVAFDLNVVNHNTTIAANKGLLGGLDFWVVTACQSYQYTTNKSSDPDWRPGVRISGCTRGISAPYWSTNTANTACGGFIPFVETCRDFAQSAIGVGMGDSFTSRTRRTTLHECGHVMGGRHEDLGLMAEGTGTNPNGGTFSGRSLRHFMLIQDKGPGYRPAP
jgi:hypothetical protein